MGHVRTHKVLYVISNELFMPEGYNFALLIGIFSSLLPPIMKLQLHYEKRICSQYVLITSVLICPRVLGHISTGLCEHTPRISDLCYRAEYELQW